MDPETVLSKTGVKVKDITVWEGAYGKKTYVYQPPNASVIIFDDPVEIETIILYKEEEKKKKNQGAPNYHLKGKMPTNLTKAEKQFQEKQEKEIIANKLHKTTISVDQVPSVVYDGTFAECFVCIDKTVEIKDLKTAKEKLKKHYEKKLQEKQGEVDQMKKRYEESQQDYKKLQKQAKQAKLETISLQNKFLMQEVQLKQLKKRLQQYETKPIMPAELDIQFIDDIKKKQIGFREKIFALQQENRDLKKKASLQETEMSCLLSKISLSTNPEVSPMKKKGSYIQKRQDQDEESYEENGSRQNVMSRISFEEDDDTILMPY